MLVYIIFATIIGFGMIILLGSWLSTSPCNNPRYLVWACFKKILRECEIKTGEDFEHFMSFVSNYSKCYDYDEILKVWKEHKSSIKKAVKRIKKGK